MCLSDGEIVRLMSLKWYVVCKVVSYSVGDKDG